MLHAPEEARILFKLSASSSSHTTKNQTHTREQKVIQTPMKKAQNDGKTHRSG